MRQFDYARPETLDDIVLMLRDGDDVRLLAGGTDLLTLMKAGIVAPSRVVDIKRTSDLPATIDVGDDGVTIGALTTLSQIERHADLKQHYTAVVEAVAQAATPQLRNRATVGGNLLQRPRCWYYRDEHFNCWLKGGTECQARDGQNEHHAIMDVSPCVAVHPSDLSAALLALDATLVIRCGAGTQRVAAGDFFTPPTEANRTENVLGDDQVIVSIEIPAPPAGARSTYLKAMDRKVWAFALVGVAVQVVVGDDGRIADARVVLGGAAPVPWRATAAEQELIGNTPDEALFQRAAQAALTDAQPLEHNAYKVDLAQAMLRRALTSVTSS